MNVPFVDLAAMHGEIADRIRTGFDAVLAAGAFVQGPEVGAFEAEYAEFGGAKHCVGVGNGTDALELSLRAAGVSAGSEVVLPANTFVATAEAVLRMGARPVLADVDPARLLLDPERAKAVAGPRTAAIVPVHLYGQLAPMAELTALGPPVIEDAAQSHGATQDGRRFFGSLAATSFYPGKNLGAYGDAGAVLTDSADLARAVRLLANHGSDVKYRHETLGFNSRLDSLQAVVLRAKLARLAEWNERRRSAATRYTELIADLPGVTPPRVAAGNEHVWHLYVVRVPHRDRVLAELRTAGVQAQIHYPVPVHLQPAFRGLGYGPGDFPVTEEAAGQILSLPLYPHITVEDQQYVVSILRSVITKHTAN